MALIPSLWDVAIAVFLILFGAFIIPALAYLKFLYPKGMMSRVLWTIGAIIMGPYMLVQDRRGQYQLCKAERVSEDELKLTVDSEEVIVDEVPENWWRFGKKSFGITYLKGEGVFQDILPDNPEAATDGGLSTERGGYYSYVPGHDRDGYVIRLHRLIERLREAGGTKLADIATEEGLRRYGGNYDMSNLVLVVYVVVMATLGAIAGLWFVS